MGFLSRIRLKINLVRTYSTRKKILNYFFENHGYNFDTNVNQLQKLILQKSPLLNNLDIKLSQEFTKLNTNNILLLLNSWASQETKFLSNSMFYELFLKKINAGLLKQEPWNHLVQISHFISSLDSNFNFDKKSLMVILLHIINECPVLSSSNAKDICIICEASFRTSTAISSPNIRKRISNILNEELTDVEHFWLVMLIKALLFSNFYDHNSLTNLAKFLKNDEIEKFSSLEQSYLLKLYANALQRENILEQLGESFFQKLKYNPERTRIKDVSVFLWACSILRINIDIEELQKVIVPYVGKQLRGYNLEKGLSVTIQILISLWMLGITPLDFFQKVLRFESLAILKDKSKNYRDISRFNLLLDIYRMEFSRHCTNYYTDLHSQVQRLAPIVRDIKKEIAQRSSLSELESILKKKGCENIKIEYPVRIYIAGCSFLWLGNKFHVDLLDSKTLLVGAVDIPNGRILAKKKLLQMMYPDVFYFMVKTQDLQFSIEEILRKKNNVNF